MLHATSWEQVNQETPETEPHFQIKKKQEDKRITSFPSPQLSERKNLLLGHFETFFDYGSCNITKKMLKNKSINYGLCYSLFACSKLH